MRSELVRRWSGLSGPVHGGTTLPEGICDFSISVNPFPLPDTAALAYFSAWENIGTYPDSANRQLVKAVSNCFRIPEKQLLMTNGSAEAFSLLASVFLGPCKKAMILSPCYSDYEHVTSLSGAELIVINSNPETGFKIDYSYTLMELENHKPDILWLCNPNNPSGVIMDNEFISEAAEIIKDKGGVVVIDEAYTAFSSIPQNNTALQWADNIISVRSLTKDFAVPGIRLGFLRGSPEIIRILDLHKPCWSVSIPAQAVGVALLKESEYFKECWNKALLLQKNLIASMQALGVDPLEVSENECSVFIFFKVPEIVREGSFFKLMYEQGVKIRDCSSMGAPGFCRIGVKTQDDNRLFLSALTKIMQEAGYERS